MSSDVVNTDSTSIFESVSKIFQTDIPNWASNKYETATNNINEFGHSMWESASDYLPPFLRPYNPNNGAKLWMKAEKEEVGSWSLFSSSKKGSEIPKITQNYLNELTRLPIQTTCSDKLEFAPGINAEGVEIVDANLFEFTSANPRLGGIVDFDTLDNLDNNEVAFTALTSKGYLILGVINATTLEMNMNVIHGLSDSQNRPLNSVRALRADAESNKIRVEFGGPSIMSHVYSVQGNRLSLVEITDTPLNENKFFEELSVKHEKRLIDFHKLDDNHAILLFKTPGAGDNELYFWRKKEPAELKPMFSFKKDKRYDFNSISPLAYDENSGELKVLLVSNNEKDTSKATSGLVFDIKVPWPTLTQKMQESPYQPLKAMQLLAASAGVYWLLKSKNQEADSEAKPADVVETQEVAAELDSLSAEVCQRLSEVEETEVVATPELDSVATIPVTEEQFEELSVDLDKEVAEPSKQPTLSM